MDPQPSSHPTPTVTGLHHVTAITGDAQRNVDFYTGTLGLRLVKRTVNFDDPNSYHLYYGDALGRPGTVLTFFAWPGGPRGRHGTGQVTATAFAAPADALPFWRERLRAAGVDAADAGARFGDPVLAFDDPDGMKLEIVAATGPDPREPWTDGGVAPAHALRGFHSVTLSEEGYERTAKLLTETMGFRAAGSQGNRFRFAAAGDGVPGAAVDVLCVPGLLRGTTGAGAVHHVAFRTPDDDQQAAWLRTVAGLGFNASPVMDRKYFRSIYFREPGGVLFEIATDAPGFAVDEDPAHLGERLMLPEQYEMWRPRIEHALPPLKLTGGGVG